MNDPNMFDTGMYLCVLYHFVPFRVSISSQSLQKNTSTTPAPCTTVDVEQDALEPAMLSLTQLLEASTDFHSGPSVTHRLEQQMQCARSIHQHSNASATGEGIQPQPNGPG